MKKYFVVLILFLSIAANAQTQWIATKVDEKIAVKFPINPEKKTGNGTVTFKCKTKDSVSFTASVLDYQVIAKIDSIGLAAIKDTREFADQLKAGIVAQRKDYELGNIEIGKWKTYTTYQILGKKMNDGKKLSLKMIVIGSKMYGLSCLVPDQLVTKDKEIFFQSLEFLKP